MFFQQLQTSKLRANAPLIVQVWRGQVLESEHSVHGVLVAENGERLVTWGNAERLTTARSALKPFQLLAALKAGIHTRFNLSTEELALMTASHNGETIHTELCIKLLRKIGKSIEDLECGAHAPYHKESAETLMKSAILPGAIHNNCSGKHCAMLASSIMHSADDRSYLDLDHPTQQAVFRLINLLLDDEKTRPWGIDGCSLPTPEISLIDLARLFVKLAAGRVSPKHDDDRDLIRIYEAMSLHPNLVAGQERFDTSFMIAAQGEAICKVGGEAIRGISIRTHNQALGAVFKVIDGAMRALHPACIHALMNIGLLEHSRLPKSLRLFYDGYTKNWADKPATHLVVKSNNFNN